MRFLALFWEALLLQEMGEEIPRGKEPKLASCGQRLARGERVCFVGNSGPFLVGTARTFLFLSDQWKEALIVIFSKPGLSLLSFSPCENSSSMTAPSPMGCSRPAPSSCYQGGVFSAGKAIYIFREASLIKPVGTFAKEIWLRSSWTPV